MAARRSHSGSPVGELEVEHVGRARVGGAHEHERARAALAGAGDQRLERVAAHQRVGGDRVGAARPGGGPVSARE